MATPSTLTGDGHLHLSYGGLMADPTCDPSRVLGDIPEDEGDPAAGYAAIFSRWKATGGAAVPSATQVHRDLLTDFDATVGAIGYFVASPTSDTGVLKVTHGYRTFTGLPTNTAHRGRMFAFVGDVVGGADLDTFELDPNQLNCTLETLCASTPELHLELLEAEPDSPTVGPLEEDDEDEDDEGEVVVTSQALLST